MGKPTTKKKKHSNGKTVDSNSKQTHAPKVFDEDTTVFIEMSQDIKEGHKLFEKRDHGNTIFRYEKAIKLLPDNHSDAAYLRNNLAACYMQMGTKEYSRAINECNLALEVSPKYTKAILKRARCFEGLNRLELACRDVDLALALEPNNPLALEISERIKKEMEKNGIKLDDKEMILPTEFSAVKEKVVKEKNRKKKNKKVWRRGLWR